MAFAAFLIPWNVVNAKRGQRQGELAARVAAAPGEIPPAMPD
ncbi:MAG: hypothetical protein ACYDAD_07695 [Acidimicrobiales bacterium]